MNILQIPDEHVGFALQRFLNIACFIGQKGERYLVLGDKEYGAVPRDGSVFLTYEDRVSKQRDVSQRDACGIVRRTAFGISRRDARSVWELVVPVDWYGDNELDSIKGAVLSEQEFVIAFHEFIDDYAEG